LSGFGRIRRLSWSFAAVVATGLLAAPGALAQGELTTEPEEVSFGAVAAGEQRNLPLSIRNIGLDPVTLTDAWLFYEDGAVEPFSVDPGSCETVDVLEAGAACEMTANFMAPQQSGNFEALVVVEGDGVEPAVALLSGQAIPAPPTLVAEPSRIGFPGTRIGAVSRQQKVRIRNTGNGLVAVPTPAVDNPHFAIVVNDCPAQLAPGAACSVGMVFRPTDGLPRPIGYLIGQGRHVGALTIGPLVVALTGTAAPRLVPPDPAKMLASDRLKSLVGSISAALRGGPRHARLADFKAPLAGMLVLRVYVGPSGDRVLLAKGRKQLAKDERHRLRVSLTREGRKLLTRPQRTRVKVVLRFGSAAERFVAERSPTLIVKPPKVKQKKRVKRR